jgi:hypothetical protein
MNVSVNTERVVLTISGSFEGIQGHFVKVLVRFSLPNQNEVVCTIENIQNDSLTCNLIVPQQAVEGIISININPERILAIGDTDISGRIEYPEKFKVYVSVLSLIECEKCGFLFRYQSQY